LIHEADHLGEFRRDERTGRQLAAHGLERLESMAGDTEHHFIVGPQPPRDQVAIVGLLQGLAEALNFGKNAGLDMEKVVAVISKGAAQSWQLENRWKTMVEGKFEGFGFASDWMRKDLNIALAEAKKNGSHMPGTALIEQYFGRISTAGHGRWDNTALMDLLRKS
jgi:3-hydroxyisobutyrate dehydrogenase-like beta-hydroxyacid dehydrogenase